MREAVIARVTEIAERVAWAEGLEVTDVELLGGGRRRVLRISIDKPEGITHADCELVSHQVGTTLDVEDVVPGGSYTLEVSSPGLERALKRPRDFQACLGKKARVVLAQPVDNQSYWEGTLTAFSDGCVTLEPAPGRAVRFDLRQVKKANLKFEW
jgi:ribosome maturation factor RimP